MATSGSTATQFLEEVQLTTIHAMWFMYDGAPAHFSVVDCNIRRSLDWSRPCFTLGLKPPGLFSMGHLESLIYTTLVENVEDFRNCIITGCKSIRNNFGVFERVRQSMVKKLIILS